MAAEITYEEWMAELTANQHSTEGQTVEEIAEKTGAAKTTIRNVIRKLFKQGHVRVVSRITMRMDGRSNRTPAYIVTMPKPAKKGKK